MDGIQLIIGAISFGLGAKLVSQLVFWKNINTWLWNKTPGVRWILFCLIVVAFLLLGFGVRDLLLYATENVMLANSVRAFILGGGACFIVENISKRKGKTNNEEESTYSTMDGNFETQVLRCNKYPKKGSREWIVGEDSIEFKVLGKEEKDKVFPIANITSVKLSMSSDTLCLLNLEISGDRKEFQMIAIDDVDRLNIVNTFIDYIKEKNPHITVKDDYNALDEMSLENKGKLNIKNILKEAVSFYKMNFRHFIIFSLIVSFFSMSIALILETFVHLMVGDYSIVDVLIASILILLGIILLILLVIYGPKLFLAIMVLINSLFEGENITLREAYEQTQGKYWKMLGCFVVIIIVASSSGFFFRSWNVEIPFDFIANLLFAACIWSLYYLIRPVIAFEPKAKGRLRRARILIRGNYGSILVLYLLTTTVLRIVNGSISRMLEGDFIGILLWTLIHYSLFFFVFPFAEVVTVVVYRTLKREETSEEIGTEEKGENQLE